MSVNIVRNLASGASRLVGASRCLAGRVSIAENAHRRLLQSQRGLTRSLWYMSSTQNGPREILTHPAPHTKMCGCCGLHTEGDKQMVEFLAQEIDLEKQMSKSSKNIKGFETKSDGTEITLTKETDNEKITVTFNLNEAIDDENDYDFEGAQENQPEPNLMAKPSFTVEINKGGSMTLALMCSFTQDVAMEQEQNQEYVDRIEIREVAMLKGSDWDEKVYTVSGDIMDGTLYDLMLNMLEERGITGDFLDEMVEFSTATEHNKYVDFLQELKEFSGGK